LFEVFLQHKEQEHEKKIYLILNCTMTHF
jgi:hypothetical protein